MLNLTARLLPDWDVDWNDRAPQQDLHTLTISDLLPGEVDGIELKKRVTLHIMHTLVEALTYLQALLPSLPERVGRGRSNVVPMKILFKDEKYKSEKLKFSRNSQRMQNCQERQRYCSMINVVDFATVSYATQVVVGDQLTCKNVRGAKRWRAN